MSETSAQYRRKRASYKLTMPAILEATEQECFYQWAEVMVRQWPELRWLHHIPNGMAASSVGTAARMKRQGMRRGIPDNCLPVARRGFHGLYLEMKRRDGTLRDLSPEQRNCLMALNEDGYCALVAFGWRDAVTITEWYLTIDFE